MQFSINDYLCMQFSIKDYYFTQFMQSFECVKARTYSTGLTPTCSYPIQRMFAKGVRFLVAENVKLNN